MGNRSRRRPKPKAKGRRRKRRPWIIFNRRNPQSRWVTVGDVVENVKERWFTFWNRVPRGSTIVRRNGKIVGYENRTRFP